MSDSEYAHLIEGAQLALRDGLPGQAIRIARIARRKAEDATIGQFSLAAVLIDGGADLRKPHLVREGVGILEALESRLPSGSEATFHYNLGNGYAYLGTRERGKGPGTRPSLETAISHLDESLQYSDRVDTRTNLAGALIDHGRWIEACDELREVLERNPDHHNALAKHGSALMGIHNWTARHDGLLISSLMDHDRAATLAVGDRAFVESYRRVVDRLRKQVAPRSPAAKQKTSFQKWVWSTRLALNPCPLCGLESPSAFDLYPLASRLEGAVRRPTTDELLDLLNTICRNYASARWVLYSATGRAAHLPSDHVITLAGSTGADHRLSVGLLMTATAGFYSLLDQIGYALNAYFHLGHTKPSRLHLDTVWSRPGKPARFPATRADIHPRLLRLATPAVAALYHLTASFQHGKGRYRTLRKLRNHLQHRIVLATRGESGSKYYESITVVELTSQAFLMGRLAKAAIWYVAAAFLEGERDRLHRAQRKGVPVTGGTGPSVRRT